MSLFKRKPNPATPESGHDPRYARPTQVEMMTHARIPVFLSKMHAAHPPRWVTVHGDRLESVVGLESEEYMSDSDNHEVWSVEHFISDFPFVKDFLNAASPGQSALFIDQSGRYSLEEG
ncbi:hypothetical protein GCM10022198_18610 [Klugiella xanthotipulae]|uniref:Uncharacterized protein n=1 Tax=Klugiella xanthotipulae TaxID=244735 RepID=A0A543HRU7_9MICO|nr:hypothetical protein [Klugiella xanthotipulae]TQM61061.1 hypothetical protein FB466_1988 [Klugiella xanthotipulae]